MSDGAAKLIDALLGRLDLAEKVAQMMVFHFPGTFPDPLMMDFIKKFGLGGLRVSPQSGRKAVPYLPDDAPGSRNAMRPLEWKDKLLSGDIYPRHIGAAEYTGILNKIRGIAFERNGLPMHAVADFEANGGDFTPYGMISLPAPMGFGHYGDMDLIKRAYSALAHQIKLCGIDWIHSPVADVNVTPFNPEISARSYHETPEMVSRCAGVALKAFRRASLIGTLKHFPGRGASTDDAHFGTPEIKADRNEMNAIHLKPYKDLISAGLVPSIMLAHSVYRGLDDSGDIATVSEKIIKGVLREELGFDGVITTDSLTMGGLIERYTISEACIRAVTAGVDLLLFKGENSLRRELHSDIVAAVKSGRIPEKRINQSLRRLWSLKWDYGLFENGGMVNPEKSEKLLTSPRYRNIGKEASSRVLRVLRDRKKMLPLRPEQKVLLIDRIGAYHLRRNDAWNYPGMFWDFMRQYSENIMYIDYQPSGIDKVEKTISEVAHFADLIVVSADYNRNDKIHEDREFVRRLVNLGKPVLMIAGNPYKELLIPDEADTVLISYGLMREQMEAVAAFLYRKK